MQLTDEETFIVQLAVTGLMDVFNRMQGRKGLDAGIMESLVNTFGVVNTHTSIGINLVAKIQRWHQDHPDIQSRVAGQLRDVQGGHRMIGLDGKPLL